MQYFVAAATRLWRPIAIIACANIEWERAGCKCKFDFTFRIVASLCNCHNVIPFRISNFDFALRSLFVSVSVSVSVLVSISISISILSGLLLGLLVFWFSV